MDVTNNFQQIATDTPIWFHFTIGTVLLITGLTSFISNGIILFIFFVKDRKLLTRTNIYIAAFCTLSFFMSAVGVPMVVTSSFNKDWMYGYIGCQYYAFLMSFGGLTSILLLCMISVDHYVYVVRNDLLGHLSSITSMAAIVACCLVALSFAFGPLLGWSKYTYEGVGTTCAIDLVGEENEGRSFVITLLIVFFTIPVSTMLFSYGSVYVKVIKEFKARLQVIGVSDAHEKEMLHKLALEKELAVTITIIIGSFLFCYTPYAFLLLWNILISDIPLSPQVLVLPSILTKIGGVFTPFIYIGRNKRFKNQLFKMFPCIRSARVHSASEAHVTNELQACSSIEMYQKAQPSKKSRPALRSAKTSRALFSSKYNTRVDHEVPPSRSSI